MPTLICTEHNGTIHRVHAENGQTVMQAVVQAMVPGLIGDCGGSCNCATCHAYIDADWVQRLSPAESMETGMLEYAIEPRANSRLTCQLWITGALDGLAIRLPRTQI